MEIDNLLILLIAACLVLTAYSYDYKSAGDLESAVLTDYVTSCRPQAQTNVTLGFGMSSITKLNIVDQQIIVSGFLTIIWNDDRLKYTATDYGNITYSYIHSSKIWVPPIVLSNAAEGLKILSNDDDLASVPIIFMESGFVAWLAPSNFIAECNVNIKYYPFDSQSCELLVSSWMYTSNELNILSDGSTFINTDLYRENGEWDLVSSSVRTSTRILFGYPMPAVGFTVNLSRKYSYYILNMILPVVFLATLGAFVFLLPVESGEKIGFSLTILLSLSVVLTIVSDSIPPTSTNICILSVYLLVTYILCTVEVLLTVIVIRVHNLDNLGYKPKPRLQRWMKTVLTKISFYERSSDEGTTLVQETYPDVEEKLENSKISEITENLPKSAWKDKKDDTHVNDECRSYTYQDLSIMIDKISFFTFLVVTNVLTLVFLLMLSLGGRL